MMLIELKVIHVGYLLLFISMLSGIAVVLMMFQYVRIEEMSSIVFNNPIRFFQSSSNNANDAFSGKKTRLVSRNGQFETTVKCVGPLYNQSCLYKNLYYVNKTFLILTVKGRRLPPLGVRLNAFTISDFSPNRREFNSYGQLIRFVRKVADPMTIPDLTVSFEQYWHHNIAHALFDGLYPAYLAVIRFAPRHLHPFRLLVGIAPCDTCWSEDVYSRFAGLGIIKNSVLERMSKYRWYKFDELIMGSGNMCERCTQPNLQLPGGIEMNGSKLFRDRMYRQHGLLPTFSRLNNSSKGRKLRYPLNAYVIDNKRFSTDDRTEINAAITEINNYTNIHLNATKNNTNKLQWPLIHVSYLYYDRVKPRHNLSVQFNLTQIDSRPLAYELTENNFMAQLQIVQKMDIHVTGPGTGQFYQGFLSDGSVTINLGTTNPWGETNPNKTYTSFLDQYMTSGTPYIKGLYYPINERTKGLKKNQIVKLIREAAQMIINGFAIPVNPQDNLAPDGQLFTEMCQKDKDFCNLVTMRLDNHPFECIDTWAEEIVHEYRQWQVGGFINRDRNVSCPLNRTLLHQLRQKYGIHHHTNS